MQVTLFKALQSIKIDDDTATKVVDQIEEHIRVKVTDANKSLEALIAANAQVAQADSKSVQTQIRANNWLVGSIGVVVVAVLAATALAPAVGKMIHPEGTGATVQMAPASSR